MSEQDLLEQCQKDGIQKIVVGAIITFNNQCLCLKRADNEFMAGLVELPSGGVDKGETLKAALIREILEETGIDIKEHQIEYINSFDYTSGSGKKARQLNFAVQLPSMPTITLNPSEHSTSSWLTSEQLDNCNMSEETKQSIRKALD